MLAKNIRTGSRLVRNHRQIKASSLSSTKDLVGVSRTSKEHLTSASIQPASESYLSYNHVEEKHVASWPTQCIHTEAKTSVQNLNQCYENPYVVKDTKSSASLSDLFATYDIAKKQFPEMSEAFFYTMKKMLYQSVGSNFPVQTLSENLLPFNSLQKISMGSNNHGYHQYQFANHNATLMQARCFSTTPDKKEEQKDLKTSKIPVPSKGMKTQEPASLSANLKYTGSKLSSLTVSAIKALVNALLKTPGVLFYYMTNPKEFKQKLSELKEVAKKEAHHYYMGSKLLVADIKTAKQIVGRTLNGTPLSRRERKQLIRTVTDVFRLVPMSIFVLIPFMEFALPIALKIFPNMLPSTFQDSLKTEENMKRELNSRLAMAEFFQETLQDLAKDQKKKAESRKKKMKDSDGSSDEIKSTENREETASSFLEFIEKARKGEVLSSEAIVKYATYFKDDLTLDNMPRMQLINMCRYMGIPPYGNDTVLRFQLRHKVRGLIEDDQRILWEGIDSLTKMELREACQERGMRSTGLSKEGYRRALQQWIDLSVNRNVPISLLVMSRTFFLKEETLDSQGSTSEENVAGLADAISGLDKELVNEVILESVSKDTKNDPELLKLKLDVLKAQNELIEEENQQREAELAKAEAEKAEKEKAAELAKAEAEQAEKDKEPELEVDVGIDTTTSQPPVGEKDTIISSDEFTTNIVEEKKAHLEKRETETLVEDKDEDKKEDDDEEERSLSTEELDAIAQIVSPDPVSVEREKLANLKAALSESDDEEHEGESDEQLDSDEIVDVNEAAPETSKEDIQQETSITVENMDTIASEEISSMDKKVAKDAEETTKISLEGVIEEKNSNEEASKESKEEPTSAEEEEEEVVDYADEKFDRALSRLKSKVESMVGKIEIQLSDVEAKIGDKLHLLDKDTDGILSREEMAICLQTVLKRKLTFEEAMAIAADIDENKDGLFSVEELSKWLETNKLVKLAEEGRDAEVDKIIETQAAKMKEERIEKEKKEP